MNLDEPRFASLLLLPITVLVLMAWTRDARERGHEQFVRAARGLATWPRGALRAAVAATCFAVAAALPQWGHGWVETPARGLDVVVVLDASKSMRARDLAPSRLERAWSELELLAAAQGPWRLGLVRFRGDAEIVSPLTDDHAAVAMLARDTDPDSVPGAGSGIARGVRAALDVFDGDPNRRRVALVLTDGESQADDEVAAVVAAARARRVAVLGVLIGTAAGAPIPRDAELDAPWILGADGAAAVSQARSNVLDAFAVATEGRVVDLAADPFAVQRIIDDELRERMPTSEGLAREWRPLDRSSWFIALGLLVAVPWWTLAQRIRPARGFATVALLCCAPAVIGADDPAELARRVNAAFLRAAERDAIAPLEALAAVRPDDARIAYDLGLARLRTGAYPEARAAFQSAAQSLRGRDRAAALHGVALAGAALAQFEESRGGERLAIAESLLIDARLALVAALAESTLGAERAGRAGRDDVDAAVRSNLDVMTFRLERIRAERAAAQSAAAGGAAGARDEGTPDPAGSASAGSADSSAGAAGAAAPGTGDATGTADSAAGRAGTVDGDTDSSRSSRLPGGMLRAEAEGIADVVRRFERDRRAFDRQRAASTGPRGGDDW